MKKFLILIIIILLGLAYVYIAYDYEDALKFSSKEKNEINVVDSFSIYPRIIINRQDEIEINLEFPKINDTILFKDINIEVSSIDNPNQKINLFKVHGYYNKSVTEDDVTENTFTDLPNQCKKLVPHDEISWKTIDFYFKTKYIDKSKNYKFKISGQILYKGQIIDFNKEITAKRKREFVRQKLMC